MRREERRTLKVGLVLGAMGASVPVLYLSFLLVFGLAVAPRPVAETTPAPPLIKDALWARADGGRATELRSINPVNLAGYIGCAESKGPDCSNWLPALRGVEYLSSLHLKDHNVERYSFRGGAGAMANTMWVTLNWTREEFLDTLAARADVGYGWRGVEAAGRGFFGRSAPTLTLPQAAFIASRVGDTRSDPWCEPEVGTAMRNRILEKMRHNGAIDEAAFQSASVAALELGPPPPNQPGCRR